MADLSIIHKNLGFLSVVSWRAVNYRRIMEWVENEVPRIFCACNVFEGEVVTWSNKLPDFCAPSFWGICFWRPPLDPSPEPQFLKLEFLDRPKIVLRTCEREVWWKKVHGAERNEHNDTQSVTSFAFVLGPKDRKPLDRFAAKVLALCELNGEFFLKERSKQEKSCTQIRCKLLGSLLLPCWGNADTLAAKPWRSNGNVTLFRTSTVPPPPYAWNTHHLSNCCFSPETVNAGNVLGCIAALVWVGHHLQDLASDPGRTNWDRWRGAFKITEGGSSSRCLNVLMSVPDPP